MINSKVFAINEKFDFFVGIVIDVNDNGFKLKTKKEGEWVVEEVATHLVYELTLPNITNLEKKRFSYVSEECKKIKRDIAQINSKIISLSNEINKYKQINIQKPSYDIEVYISKLNNKYEIERVNLENKTIEYIKVKQDNVFNYRIDKLKTKLTNNI